jgi:hypothetical protein
MFHINPLHTMQLHTNLTFLQSFESTTATIEVTATSGSAQKLPQSTVPPLCKLSDQDSDADSEDSFKFENFYL